MSEVKDGYIEVSVVPINGYLVEDYLKCVRDIAQSIVELTEDEMEKYKVIPGVINIAKKTLEKAEMLRKHEDLLDDEDVNDMIYTLIMAFYLENKKHGEALKEAHKYLKETDEYLKESETYFNQRNALLDKITEINEVAYGFFKENTETDTRTVPEEPSSRK